MQKADFSGNLLGKHGPPKLPDHLDFVIPLPIRPLGRRKGNHPQGLVHFLDAPVLQAGHGYGRHIDSDGPKEQIQDNAVQTSHSHIAAAFHRPEELPGQIDGTASLGTVRLLLIFSELLYAFIVYDLLLQKLPLGKFFFCQLLLLP